MNLRSPILFLCAFSALAAFAGEGPPWQRVAQTDGITLSLRDIPDSPIVMVRGETELDAPPGVIAHVIMDCARAPEWVDRLEECVVLRKISELEYVTYNHFGTPFIVKDRDFVARAVIRIDRPKKTLIMDFTSIEEPSAPKTRYVRGRILLSRYTLCATPDGKRTLFTGEAQVDPMGSIPKWLVNHFQRKWPLVTIQALRLQLKKPDLATPVFFQHVLDDPKAALKP